MESIRLNNVIETICNMRYIYICIVYIYFRLLGICEKKKKCNCSIIVVDDDDDFKYCVLLTLYNGITS